MASRLKQFLAGDDAASMPSSIGGTQEVPDEYADAEHGQLIQAHRRTKRSRQAILVVACSALALVAMFVPGLFKLYFGLFAGAGLAAIVYVRDRRTRWAGLGECERRTAKALESLTSAGWVHRHDRRPGSAEVDHLLIGPAGVYLISTKDWPGDIWISEAGFPRCPRTDTADEWAQYALPGRMRAAATATSQALTAHVGQATSVTAVVVFWGQFPQGVVSTDKVTYVHGDVLVSWLRAQPETLSAADRQSLLATAPHRGHANGEPPPPGSPIPMEYDA